MDGVKVTATVRNMVILVVVFMSCCTHFDSFTTGTELVSKFVMEVFGYGCTSATVIDTISCSDKH